MERRNFYLIMMLVATMLLTFCKKDDSDVDPDPNLTLNMYADAKEIAPEFESNGALKSSLKTTEWGSGNPIYEIFYALQEFNPATDEGVIDRANMYKMLYDATTLWEQLSDQGEALSSPQEIVPPYDFDNDYTYGYAKNLEDDERAVAYSDDKAIVSWIWRESNHPLKAEYGVLEAVKGDTIDDLFTVDFIFSVDYDTSSTATEYNLRSFLTGSTEEHSFEYKFIKGGSTEEGYMIQMVAKGISQGEDNFFLFKIQDNETLTTPRYFVIAAEATEADLQAMDIEIDSYSNPDDLPATVSDYKEFVVNTSFFEFSDLMVNTNQLNIGNANAGTIYIDF